MISLISGVVAYIIAGISSMFYSRYKFLFSLLGLSGATGGLIKAVILYRNQGELITDIGKWGMLGIEIKVDQTTLLFAALVVSLNFLTLIYLRNDKPGSFYILYNFLLAAAFSLAFSNDLFNIYVLIEFLSLISIMLIGYERRTRQIYAGIKYLVISSIAMSLYLIGLGIVYRTGGHLSIGELAESLAGVSSPAIYVGIGLMVTGLATKGGVFLFSMWLPDAYAYSDTVVSVLLSGMATKAGLMGIIRLSGLIDLNNLLLGLGAITGIAGAIFAIISRRPKRILAFSSISQTGYILFGVGLGTMVGVVVASLHMLFHGLFKGLLFLSVGHSRIGNKDLYKDDIPSIPLISKVGLIVGSLSIIAVPPFSGYFSKGFLLENAGHGWLWWIISAISFGTVIYIAKLCGLLLLKPTGDLDSEDIPLIGFILLVILSPLFGLTIVQGKEIFDLLAPHHLLVTFSLLTAGLLALITIWRDWSKLSSPAFPFQFDNALISVIIGFLLVFSSLFFI